MRHRSSLSLLLGFTIAVLMAGCAANATEDKDLADLDVPEAASAGASSYVKGADVSEALYAADKGVNFKDTNGVAKPPLTILRDHGYSWVRCRLMVDGTTDYALFQDIAYVKRTALTAKNLGMKFLLDLHYSHWWADPANQWTPARWKSYTTASSLSSAVYSYTKDVMSQLVAQGTPPQMVQIGNEVNDGMLWEVGRLSKSLANFVQLEVAGANGVRDGRGSAPMPPIMVHIAKTGTPDQNVAWYQSFIKAGGWVDVIGLSYYPMWHGSLSTLSSAISKLRAAFSWAPIYVVEAAYYWSPNEAGYTGLPYPQTPAGQAAFLQALKSTAVSAGASGIFYWGTFWSQSSNWLRAPGWSNDDASRRALFDDGAVAQVAIDSL